MIPHQPTEQTPTIFFDNGFLRKLTGKNSCQFKGNYFSTCPEELRVILRQYRPWRTPFSVVEWIGIQAKDFAPPVFDQSHLNRDDGLERLLEDAKGHFASQPGLQAALIKTRFSEQRCEVHSDFLNLWDALFYGIYESDFSGWIHTALAVDALQKIQPPTDFKRKYFRSLLFFGLFSGHSEVLNLSKYRIADGILKWLWLKIPKENKPFSQKEFENITLKGHKDLADTDLLHVATLGVQHRERRAPAVCLTCDNPEQVKIRIGIYRAVISWARNKFDDSVEERYFPHDMDSQSNGDVYCFSHGSGQFVEHIKVNRDTSSQPFLNCITQSQCFE